MLRQAIINMYRRIANYRGDFGDPIETGFNPIDLLNNDNLTPFEQTGLSVAILISFVAGIDNSTYKVALESPVAKRVRDLLRSDSFTTNTEVWSPILGFFVSEKEFLGRLDAVYQKVVLPGLKLDR